MAREDWGEGEGGCGGKEEASGGSSVVVGEGSVGREAEPEVGDGVEGEGLVVVEAVKEEPWMILIVVDFSLRIGTSMYKFLATPLLLLLMDLTSSSPAMAAAIMEYYIYF